MRLIENRQVRLVGGVAFLVALGGCNSFDEKAPTDSQRLVIPVDERAATTSSVAPKPISGGTLAVTADGRAAVLADPERDQISIVDLQSLVPRTIPLTPGDEPGRIAEDGSGRVHVALRSGGAVVSIDLATASVVDRRAVCKAPRGIAFDATSSLLHVACAEGKLVSLPALGGEPTRVVTLEPDLRDVVVRGEELWITRFKSAEVLRVSSTGALSARVVIPPRSGTLTQPGPDSENFGAPITKPVTMQPRIAYRALANVSGGAVVVHQEAVADEIEITEPSSQGSAYGGGAGGFGFDCSGIVRTVVTRVNPDGTSTSTGVPGAPLPVDIAVSPDQTWIAMAHAGPADQQAPRPSLEFVDVDGDLDGGGPVAFGGSSGPGAFGGGTSLTLTSVGNLDNSAGCAFHEGGPFIEQPVTAVAFTPDGRLLAQTREPPQLIVIQNPQSGGLPLTVALPGDSRLDTGHELFHRDSGGGIACASCHPEAGEDGQTWRFADVGDRRTQALNVGLRGTAPFHWNGDLANVGELMSEVFVQRMGGVRQSSSRLTHLTEWLFSLQPPPAIRDAADPAAVRGQELFNSADVGCATCHTGEKLTNNQSMAIDSVNAKKLQVPSLVAIGYRAPFMHTGCATTLLDRFNPACGGNAHGNVAGLQPEQLTDLVAYLESL